MDVEASGTFERVLSWKSTEPDKAKITLLLGAETTWAISAELRIRI
jgi:hypothetical protein